MVMMMIKTNPKADRQGCKPGFGMHKTSPGCSSITSCWEFHSGMASSLPLTHLFSPQIMEPRAAGWHSFRERCSWRQPQLLLQHRQPWWLGGIWSIPGFPRVWRRGCAVPETPGEQPGLQIPVSDGPPARSSHPIPPWALPMFVLPTTSAAPQLFSCGWGTPSREKRGLVLVTGGKGQLPSVMLL